MKVDYVANVSEECWKQAVFTDKRAIAIHFRIPAARTGTFPFSLDDQKVFLAANTQTPILKHSLLMPPLTFFSHFF